MNLKALRIKDGGVTVKWTQEAANGCEAKWQCTDAVKPQEGLAPAMVALVPHVAKLLGLDATITELCAFSSITLTEKTDKAGNEYTLCQIILALPSPGTDKPAAAKTDRFATDSVNPQFSQAIDDMIEQGMEYARLSCAARDAV